ncbi:ATP synthase subunit I [Desulforhopalus vacuolatus]|uniref:N-ATPase subunit AtpR n=1 Tax=Desulforhopalus vacuolatus TaxID=40414 RepID=UPI0019646928|nr:ATP synthase subunit I [Desulforhopalus vacuolatus]MBM9518962.1 ATP synthase subunit I [Desulforhopalus vacuolatus]
MNEVLTLFLVTLAGFVLGILFFGGLWWTVQKVLSSNRPTLWLLGSLVLRTTVVLAGLYIIARDDLKKLLFCLTGFIIARIIITRYTGLQKKQHILPARETDHATES